MTEALESALDAHQLDERPEWLDGGHSALVDLSHFGRIGHFLRSASVFSISAPVSSASAISIVSITRTGSVNCIFVDTENNQQRITQRECLEIMISQLVTTIYSVRKKDFIDKLFIGSGFLLEGKLTNFQQRDSCEHFILPRSLFLRITTCLK